MPRVGSLIPPTEQREGKVPARLMQASSGPMPRADEDVPVPQSLRRRLRTVLRHISESKEGKCAGSIGQNSCAGIPIDIEDLGNTGTRRHSSHVHDDNEVHLFDPQRYSATQKPLLEASTLPAEPYSSQKWFERELGRVFMPSWLLVGRADEMSEPGQYLAVDTEWGGPVVVCRGKDGNLHAFANVCRHRGAKLVPDGAGKASKVGLICPYHAWTYEYTGNLKWAPGMDDSKEFDEDTISLAPVRFDTFCGFVFVCHSATAPPLAECLGDLPEKLPAWFGPEGAVNDMVCGGRAVYDVPCNWKFLMENTCETYHTSVVHKNSLGPMKSSPMEAHVGDWDGVRVQTDRSVVPLPTDFEGNRFPMPAFTDSTTFVNIFPCLQINVTWDCIWWMNVWPTGVQSTRISQGFCFPRETVQLDHFPATLERYLLRWSTAVEEDNMISINQQRGVRSAFRVPGRFCRTEFGTHNFNNWLLSKMLDDQLGAWDPGSRLFVADDTKPAWNNFDERMVMLASESENIQTQKDHSDASKAPRGKAAAGVSLTNGANVYATGAVGQSLSAKGAAGFSLTNGANVCVTGASGFIGLHVVKLLLARGCNVTAAVRNASDDRKMSPLLAMQRTARPGALKLVGGCDVLSPGSFDSAVADSVICFHLASPFWMDDRITDPHAELIAPAEQGTLNVLASCAKSHNVRRVVITSSFGAVMNVGGRDPWPMDFHYSEQHWNGSSAPIDGVFPEPQNAHAYRWSKTVAEKAAYAFVDANRPQFDVTCILPPMVLGPNMQELTCEKDINQSSLILFKMLSGQMSHVNPGSVGFADVQDVAKAHILAGEAECAGGQRYLCSGTTQTWLHVASVLRDLFPGRPVPSTCADGSTEQPCMLLDNSKIKSELGMQFMPLAETLKAQGTAFIEAGLLQST